MALPSNARLEGGTLPAAARWPAIDVVRGLAVVAMVVYHSAWDLSELAFVATDIRDVPAWNLFARTVAATFLALSGIGLAFAHRAGVRWRPFLRRLGVVGGAAAAVTVVTYFVFPDSYIYFGVLHNIALSSVLALPFLGLPSFVAALVGALLVAAPWLIGGPAFDAPLLAFLGLGTAVPLTNDYVPVCPWTGCVLLGVAAGRLLLGVGGVGPGSMPGRPVRIVSAVGRRSLVIYLLHQPVIFGALLGLRAILGPNLEVETARYLRECESICGRAAPGQEVCRKSCACTADELKRDGLWPVVTAGRGTDEELARAATLARMCLKRAE